MQIKKKALLVSIALIVMSTSYFGISANGTSQAEAADRMNEIQAVLNQSELGRLVMAQAEQYEVDIQFKAGGGTLYKTFDNAITIDVIHSPERAALSFVHEMVHARYHHEGIRPHMSEVGREAYVEARILEEAEAVALAIEAKIALQAAGVDFGPSTYPLEGSYMNARDRAKNSAIARERDISQVELAQIGQAAGEERAVQAFVDGELATSREMVSYLEYYGSCWDRTETVSTLAAFLTKLAPGQQVDGLANWAVDFYSDYC